MRHHEWTEQELSTAVDLLQEGHSYEAAATAIGVTKNMLMGALDRRGLRPGSPIRRGWRRPKRLLKETPQSQDLYRSIAAKHGEAFAQTVMPYVRHAPPQ